MKMDTMVLLDTGVPVKFKNYNLVCGCGKLQSAMIGCMQQVTKGESDMSRFSHFYILVYFFQHFRE